MTDKNAMQCLKTKRNPPPIAKDKKEKKGYSQTHKNENKNKTKTKTYVKKTDGTPVICYFVPQNS